MSGSALLLCCLLEAVPALPLFTGPCAAAEASTPASVEDEFKAIEELVKAYYPRAKFTRSATGLHFEHKVRREYGYYSNEVVLAPQEGGILGDISLKPGVCNEMQSIEADGFHSTLILCPYSKNLNSHLLVKLTFPSSDFSINFQDQFTDLVERFGAKDDVLVQPPQPDKAQPTNATKQPAEAPHSSS